MGKCLELPLLSAWVTKGWGSRSVQRVLLQIGTLIIHNQTYQVSSAEEEAALTKLTKRARELVDYHHSQAEWAFFSPTVVEREWEAHTFASHPMDPITDPLMVLPVSAALLLEKVHPHDAGLCFVSLLSHSLEPCGVTSLSRALLPISHLLIQSHIWKRLQEKGSCLKPQCDCENEWFFSIVWNTFLIHSNFIWIQLCVACCTCRSPMSRLLL